MLTLEILARVWPHGDQHVPGLIEGIVASAPAVFAKYGVDSPLALAHMMAQFSEECGCGLEMVENLNYSAQGLVNTWPSRFGPARAADYAHNPQRIADAVYGGRMGNAPPPSDDGWNFRGRGLSQTTGRDAYKQLGDLVGLDLLNEPDLVNAPANALECGTCDFVTICKCLEPAKADDVTTVTRRLNGGLIGFAARKQQLALWKRALDV